MPIRPLIRDIKQAVGDGCLQYEGEVHARDFWRFTLYIQRQGTESTGVEGGHRKLGP
jgi:hypothetical protein